MDSFQVPSSAFPSEPSVAVPAELLRRLASTRVDDREFQIVLILAAITLRSSGPDAAVSYDALIRHDLIASAGSIEGTSVRDDEWFVQPLEQALSHGFLLRFTTSSDDVLVTWYLLNTLENAAFVSRFAAGSEAVPESFWISNIPPRIELDRPTVFRLYEQNIGPLTPLIAERLIKAVELYSVDWIEAAIAEAVTYNRRNWRYIARILENWATDGLPSSTRSL